jgi:2-hydroxychromene-2-carboxylate isomerase
VGPPWPASEFWYEFASTYSYPAAMRIERLASAAGVAVRWRPFLLGPIFKTYGWNDSPFNIFAAKGRYMWRDLERICAADGLPLKLPPVSFPQNGLKAARLALVGERAGLDSGLHPRRVHRKLRRAEGHFRRRDPCGHSRRPRCRCRDSGCSG